MQNNFDDLFESVNVEEAAKLLDCIGDIQMNEQDRINMRNNVLIKAEKYGIKSESFDNIEKRGKNMNNDKNSEITGSVIDFNNDNKTSTHSKFNNFLKIACIFVVAFGVGSMITFSIIKNNNNYKVQSQQRVSEQPLLTNPAATEKSETSTPAPTDTNNTKTPEPGEASTTIPDTTNNSDIDINKINISYEGKPDDYKNYMIITATYEKEVLWTYKTESVPLTELDTVQKIGEYNGLIYVSAAGITAIDKLTGKVVWKNTNFSGGGIAFDFDDNGTLYICSYYITDICAIDKNGKTLWSTDFNEPEGWGTGIKVENGVLTLTTATELENKHYKYNTSDGKKINK